MGRIWKEIFMASFEVQLMHLPGETEEGHEELVVCTKCDTVTLQYQ